MPAANTQYQFSENQNVSSMIHSTCNNDLDKTATRRRWRGRRRSRAKNPNSDDSNSYSNSIFEAEPKEVVAIAAAAAAAEEIIKEIKHILLPNERYRTDWFDWFDSWSQSKLRRHLPYGDEGNLKMKQRWRNSRSIRSEALRSMRTLRTIASRRQVRCTRTVQSVL